MLLSGPVMMFPALRSQMNCSFGHPQHLGQQRIEPHVNAGQRHHRQLALELRRVQPGALVTGHRAVIGIYDGFEQAHGAIARDRYPAWAAHKK